MCKVQRFLLFAESFANRFAPNFFLPILAARAPGFLTPLRLSFDLSEAKRLPDPRIAFRAI
jgi:hypothetical protein